jgi:hypothetical protein
MKRRTLLGRSRVKQWIDRNVSCLGIGDKYHQQCGLREFIRYLFTFNSGDIYIAMGIKSAGTAGIGSNRALKSIRLIDVVQ